MELVRPIFGVLNCLGVPISECIEHHRKLEERMNDLRTKLGELNDLRSDVEKEKKNQFRRGKIIKKQVEKWLRDVTSNNENLHDIEERMQNVSCFSRALLGKRVGQTVKQVEELIKQGKSLGPVVIDDPSPAELPFPVENLEGETSVKEKIWNYLMVGDIGMIGVWGMGGIGKTTIMKHIRNQLVNKNLFDKVIWVTVSKELNIPKLQQDIANAMKMGTLPETEPDRAAELMAELGRKKYVLILDDVWEELPLSQVGIPTPTSSKGSKLVLTSRSMEVCRKMDCEIVEVHPLPIEQSKNLFLEHVGREVLQKNPFLEEILGDIVRECDGLPLAIVVTAKSMKGIYSVHDWKNALRELREHVESVRDTDAEIYEKLKFSFDRLRDSKTQNCFLYCSLYPEDFIIPRTELIEYWIDEGFLGTVRRKDLYSRGHSILRKLVDNCLLEKDGDNVKMHDVVRDTALYIKSVGPRFMVKAGMALKDLPSEQGWMEDLERVSFMVNSISEIPSDLSPNCETLSTLLLRNNMSLQRISESFFQHMHSLSILDLSYTDIERLPNSVSNMEKLKSLVLCGCYNLRYVPSLEKLKALRKLDLCYTAIEKVPDGLEMLVNLTYLNLFTKSLKKLPTAILPKLSCLQYLVFSVECSTLKISGSEAARLTKLETFEGRFHELIDFNSYSKSIQGKGLTSYMLCLVPLEAKINFIPLELGDSMLHEGRWKPEKNTALTRFKQLEIVALQPGVNCVLIDGYGILRVGGQIDPIQLVRALKWKIGLKGQFFQLRRPDLPTKEVVLSGWQIGREDPVTLPIDLSSLRIFECHNLKSLSNIPFFQQTNELKFCSIEDCRGIESLLDLSSSSSPCSPCQNLKYLRLERLDNLHVLVKLGDASAVSTSSSLPLPGIFSPIKSFKIEGCSNMKQLFPLELAQDLPHLKKLVVVGCGQMEEIIASEEEEENHKGKGISSPMSFALPQLRELKLENLPKLKSIYSSNGVITCDSLRDIEVLECPNLKRMPLCLPLFEDTDQPDSHPFERIYVHPKEWWESVEWDYPNAKKVLQSWLESDSESK